MITRKKLLSAAIFLSIFAASRLFAGSLTSVSATPGTATAGASTSYTVNFTTDGATGSIPADGLILITFPVGFDVSGAGVASSANANMTGGLTAGVGGQVVTLTRDGTGNAVGAGVAVSVQLAIVTNSTTTGSSFTVDVETQTNGGGNIDGPTTSGTFSVSAGAISQVQIEDAAGGTGSEINTISTTTDDDAQQFFAVGRDQFDNFVSDVSVTWSVNGGIGSVGAAATSTTLTLTAPGSGSVFADDGSGHVDATGTITVTVGALNSILLVDGASGETPEVGARSMTTDQSLTVHAAGFDADGNYRSDESVTWSVTGGIGAVSPTSGTSTTFDAQTVTTGTVVATHATAGSDASGTITVNVGLLSFVRVNSGASGNTSEVTTNTLTTGGTFTVHASGYDADGNYRSDESVTWSVTGGIGTLSSGSGVSTVLTATTPGTGVIQADHATAIDDATGTITVNAGAIDHILIRTAPDNGGSELDTASLTADETLTLYAASYDAQDAYLGDVSVTWSLASGTLAPTPSGTGSSFAFSPTTASASGVIRATHATAGTDDTGTISVSVGIINFIRVNSGASGNTSAVTTQALTADQTLQVHASEYDADSNYRGDLSVTWSVSGGIGSLTAATGVSTTLNANTVGEGVISADDGSGHADATGAITVTFGALVNIIVVEGESGSGSALGSRSITSDQTLTVHAAGFDADGNYRSDESVTWSVTGGIGAASPTSGTSTTFDAQIAGSGVIRATHATAGTDDSGTITVSAGVLNFVRVNIGATGNTAEVTTNTLTTGQTFTVHASGYDADGNYRSDESVTWGVTGGIGTLSTGSGISTTLTATTPGTGVIQADHATAIDDATGTITVQAGAIDHILVRNAPDNGGIEVGAASLTADETLTLYAASYDDQDIYLGDVSVTWSAASGDLAPTISGTGSSLTFSPTTAPASGVIRATHATAGIDDTGTISVSVGALNSVRINSGASSSTSEVTTNTLTTGQTFTVHASGYDADGNYLGDESVSWDVTGGIGTLSASSGVSTILTATTPGTGVIQADHATATDDATGTITVQAGAIDHILIRNAPDNGGSEAGNTSLTADETITLYAAGYDAQDIFLGDVSVAWSLASGDLAPTPSGTGSSFTFSPTTAPTSGAIRATHASAGSDDTGTITVSTGGLSSVRVNSGSNGNTSEVGTNTLTTGAAFAVHASGYDSDGNYRGDVNVTWSVTGGIGTLSTNSGVSSTLTATTPGTGVIQADHVTALDDATGTITVQAGAIDHIRVRTAPDNGGSEVGAVTMTADETLNLFAAGYDAQDIFLGDVSVTWSSASGNLAPGVSGTGSSFTFSPSTAPTNGVIRATHATAGNDDTGPITVGAGALSYVQVNNGATGNTSAVSSNTLTTGGTFTVHASGYDSDGNYRNDETVSWSVTGGIGNLSTNSGVSTTLTATTPGTGVIQADHATALDDATGTITVQAGAIDHILVRNAPDNGGNEIGAVTITADEIITLYAAAYDAQDIYLGDVSVTWSSPSGNLEPAISGSGSSFVFNPTTAPTSGIIRATHATAGNDDTGLVTVTVGSLSFVRVNSGPTGNTSEVTTNTLTTGGTFTVHASGYDGDGNYTSDETVTWNVTGGIGSLSIGTGVSTTLTATTPGTGVIQADHATAIDDATGTITVQAGAIDHILVRDAPDNGGVEVGSVGLNADEILALYAASYDAQNVYLGDVGVTWSLESGTLAPTPSGSGSSFTFSPTTAPASGTIRATHATAGNDDTGTISVTVGALSFVRVNSNASGNTAAVTTNTLTTGQTFTVHASGYDADGNYSSDESVGWSVTGGIGSLDISSGISTTFTATTPGSGVIQADHVTAIDDATGTITVIEGAIDHIIIRNAPGNAGIELGDFTLSADDSITVYAAAYDGQNNYLNETDVTWSASGNLAPVSSNGTEFTFSPTTAPANGRIRASHPTASDDSTGIATVTPGSPVGTVALTATPNTVSADDTSKARVTSSTIFDSDGNPVGTNRLFTVSLSNASLGDIITPDAAPGQAGHQVATTADSELDFVFESDTLGGSVTIFVSSIGGSAQGNTTVSVGALNIISISATPTFVSKGQSGVAVQMVVENTSSSSVTSLGASLTFSGSGAADRTGEYTQNRTDGAASIPAQSQITLSFEVTILTSATEETITIDGNVNGLISSTPVADQDASVTDSWTVQGAAQLQAVNVTSPLDTVVVGQQNTIAVRISNPAPAGDASVVIDNILLRFLKDGITDRSSDFLFSPLAGNPVSVQAGQDTVFNFAVNVTSSADTGSYVVNVEVSGHDTNSVALVLNDLGATTTLDWHVKGAPTLQILSLTAQPNQAFVAGQTVPWFVEMAVRNNGPDDIALSFLSASSFIRFTIGVDVTGEYTILQPTQLKSAGTNTLAGGATDTLEFTVQLTGTTTGTAAISGRVGGTVVASGGAISDDTNDGGTGAVLIRSAKATVIVAATNPVTPNPNTTDEFGFANTGQSFGIDVLVKNDLAEPVENVQVRLNSDTDLSNITLNPVLIPEIVASGVDTAKFTVIASSSPNLSGEIFTAIIESATGKQSQQPAQVGIPLDDNVNIRIQTPANLSVNLTVDRFQTTNSTFDVQATVGNLGQAEVDASGRLRLDIPPTYTLQPATPAAQTFTVDSPVLWQVVAPATATILDTFIVSVDQSPIELNTGSLAAIATSADSQEVVTTQTDLVIQDFAIIDPAGATDDTLSTEQDFTIEVDLSVSPNIDSVRADLTRPGDDYTFVSGSSSSTLLLPGQETTTWRLTVPDQEHGNPRAFRVRVRGYDEGVVTTDTTGTLEVVAVSRATVSFQQFRVSIPTDAQKVSVGQAFQLSAFVINNGQARVDGPVSLLLDLQDSGITVQDSLRRVLDPDNGGEQVTWDVTAPDMATGLKFLTAMLETIPNDENTNNTAERPIGEPLTRQIDIETVEVGTVEVDTTFISSPVGAVDSVVSSAQSFFIRTTVKWRDAQNVRTTVSLPPGFQANPFTISLTDVTSGEETVEFQIIAPTSGSPGLQDVVVQARGDDASNEDVEIQAVPDTIPVQVVDRAELQLSASITGPASALDRILTVGQRFTIRADLSNRGQANLNGSDLLEITLPSGYATIDSLIQTITPSKREATWEIIAPDQPTLNSAIVIEVEDRDARDENSGFFPNLTPNPAQINIAVSTRFVGLAVSLLSDRRQTTITRGASGQGVFGLSFNNDSDANIVLETIRLQVRDRDEQDLAPNSVLNRLSVVDYFDSGTLFEEISPLPANNPVDVNFNPTLAVPPNQSRSIEFRVQVQDQTDASDFSLTIDNPQTDILARVVESDSLVAIIDSTGLLLLNALSSGTSVLTDGELAESFFNFPNPFGTEARPVTWFNFNLEQNSNVSVKIYTLLGELVWSSASFQANDLEGQAGTHTRSGGLPTITWDGKNDEGQTVLNGVYVAVLTTAQGRAITKIAVAK